MANCWRQRAGGKLNNDYEKIKTKHKVFLKLLILKEGLVTWWHLEDNKQGLQKIGFFVERLTFNTKEERFNEEGKKNKTNN